MTNAELTVPKQRVIGTPFPPGQSGNPAGRPKGSRNRLAENFLADLKDAWETHGTAALEACAVEEPAKFCKIVADLLPKSIDLNVAIDAVSFGEKFRSAQALLGNEEPERRRRPLRNAPRMIEHER